MTVLKDDISIGYPNIVVHNFFMQLKRKEISQKKYASDNNIDATILSKWKSGDSSPTLDQIVQAAKYFEVTVNDLVYTEKEKKHLEVFADKTYDPIIAQQTFKIKLFDDVFDKPNKVLTLCFILFVFLFFIVVLLMKISLYFSILLAFGIPIISKAIEFSSFREKTYIINYLDDLFYRRKESKYKFYFISLLIRIFSLIMIFYYLFLFKNFDSTSVQLTVLYITLVFIMMILLAISFSAIFLLPKKFKLEIYDHEIETYNISRLFLTIHFGLFTNAILFCIYNLQLFYHFGIISIFLLTINIIDYVIISKQFAKYELVYQENDKEPRKLMPK